MCQRGFTLLELVVTMVIAGILLAIATLDFGTYVRKSGTETQVKELYADLQDARGKAAFTKRRHSVEFFAQQAVFRRFSSEADLVGTTIATKKVTYALTTNWTAPNVIEFDTHGVTTDQSNPKVVCIATPVDAAFDAIIISPVNTLMAKVINRGAPCAITNVVQK